MKLNLLEPGHVQATVAKATTYAGGGSAVGFGLAAAELAALGGLVIAALGFVYNIWVQERRIRIEARRAGEDSNSSE